MSDRLTVLTSKSVFTGTGDLPFEGFVAVRGNRIEAVGGAGEAGSFLAQADEVIEFDREVIYATALLHDIGKDEQYESGISHDVASERVADAILSGMSDDVAFAPADAAAIKTAILGHRKLRVNSQPLERLLYAADKASRACFACPARNACNWSDDKKNLSIRV